MSEKHTRIIECPKCKEKVEEVYYIYKTGISQQYAWCTCGWGGSYPFTIKNPMTGKYTWESKVII